MISAPARRAARAVDGVVGVDGDDGVGTLAQQTFEDREKAGLLFGGGDGHGAGAGGLGAEVEDVGAVVVRVDGGGDGLVGGGAAVAGEAVGGDVDDGHQATCGYRAAARECGAASGTADVRPKTWAPL